VENRIRRDGLAHQRNRQIHCGYVEPERPSVSAG
jgi:hypothetical protein